MERCPWCLCKEKMVKYHDEEWGVTGTLAIVLMKILQRIFSFHGQTGLLRFQKIPFPNA